MAIAFCIFSFGVAKYIYGRFSEKAVLGEIKKAQEFMLWGVIALFILVSIWGIIKILQGVVGIDNNDIKVQTFNFDSGYSDKKDTLTIELEKEAPSGGNKNIGKLELEKIDTGGLTYNIPPTTILYKDPNLTPIKGDGNQNEPDKKTSTLPKTFTITFVCAEGATCPSEKMIEEGQAIGEVKEPVLDDDYINDYTFKGWSLARIDNVDNKDKIKIYTNEEIKVIKPTESLTFYNNYKEKTSPPTAPWGDGGGGNGGGGLIPNNPTDVNLTLLDVKAIFKGATFLEKDYPCIKINPSYKNLFSDYIMTNRKNSVLRLINNKVCSVYEDSIDNNELLFTFRAEIFNMFSSFFYKYRKINTMQVLFPSSGINGSKWSDEDINSLSWVKPK